MSKECILSILKNTEQSDSRFKMVRLIGLKLDKAYRYPYWTFGVGCSMFDVQFVRCSGHVKFHKSVRALTSKLLISERHRFGPSGAGKPSGKGVAN